MSASATATAAATAPAAVTFAARLRARGVWVLVVVLGVAALVAMALASSSPPQMLDPDDAGPNGGKALVAALRHHGVDVEVVRSVDSLVDAGPAEGTTVVMANPDYLGHDSAAVLGEVTADVDRLVLLDPTTWQLEALDLPLVSAPSDAPAEPAARCAGGVARDGDRVDVVDVRFAPGSHPGSGKPELCFALRDPRDGKPSRGDMFAHGAAMATVPAAAGRPEVVALGISGSLTNRRVDQESHAGVAVRALGQSPRLVWYQPGIGDLADFASGEPAPSPWPRWLGPAAVVLATALVVLAVVRGRRMGALVPEPLPVVVRAVETTESRGRLYRRARDRARAAAILRAGTTERLARRLAVPAGDVAAVQRAAAHASGMPVEQVAALLTGAMPTHDAELQALATRLTELEERVRTT